MVAYNETNKNSGDNETSIKKAIKKIIKDRCKNFDQKKFEIINKALLIRINYIVFPIWELDLLLDTFQSKVDS